MSNPWPQGRRDELKLLESLLNDAALLNSGSHVIERMQRIIETAEKLKYSDIRTGRTSFTYFLVDQAFGEREGL